ncbi:leucine-rich repeat domain-containing protein [Limibacter armeniacum]|uniref:leucine-rich repeat domain-containing protein n=1 Tax=Limibacter armeniacum TaxID=466084 RepID=UPI002FE6AA09
METIFSKLEQQLQEVFPELANTLNPPATEAQLMEVEKVTGLQLPEDLKSLYRMHNGESGYTGLFFGLPFLSLEKALQEWNLWVTIAGDDSFASIDSTIISVPTGHIKEQYANKKYFPISEDGGGNNIVVDLDPDTKGQKGQIINSGRDETTRYVIAPNITAFIQFISAQIDNQNYVIEKEETYNAWYLKQPANSHFLDALSNLDLPYGVSAIDNDLSLKRDDFNFEELSSEWKDIVTSSCKGKVSSDAVSKIKILSLLKHKIEDISPLKYFTGIRELILSGNPISDISPLTELSDLKILYLAKTNVQDITELAKLENLVQLSLYGLSLKDFSALSEMKKLKVLGAESSGLTTLGDIAKIKNLTDLNISNNQLESFEELTALKKLVRLDISNTNVNDISFISQLTKLKDLSIYRTEIKDFSPLAELPSLEQITCTIEEFMVIKELLPRKVRFGISGEMTEAQKEVWLRYGAN